MKKAYTVKYRRKREGRTDYRSRLGLLSSGKIRIVVRKMLNNIIIQFIKFENKGDKVLVSGYTRELIKYGWKAHRGNLPSSYLVGYLSGLKAVKKGVVDGVLDIGLSRAVKGSAFFGAVRGLMDAGINVACSDEVLPSEDICRGQAIVNYAKQLSNDKDKYSKQFSGYLKAGIKPESLREHFEEVKKKLSEKWQ